MPERKATRTEDKERHVVLSVRLPETGLTRLQAYAAVYDTTPNAILRQALDEFISRRLHTKDHQHAIRAYLERARAQVAAVSPDILDGETADAEDDRPDPADEHQSAA